MTKFMGRNSDFTPEEHKSLTTFAYGLFGGTIIIFIGVGVVLFGYLGVGLGVAVVGFVVLNLTFRKSDKDFKKVYGGKNHEF